MVRRKPKTDPFPGAQSTGAGPSPRCQWRGCEAVAHHRAPTDRSLSAYYLFCRDHARAYNAQWDYHAGMSEAEIEADMRRAALGERPTWKLGSNGPSQRAQRAWENIHDPFDTLRGDPRRERQQKRKQSRKSPVSEREQAMVELELHGPVTETSLKAKYKELVKRYHPDANGGSAEAEMRMKRINAAYQTLRAGIAG